MNIVVCVKQIPDPETPASQFAVDEAAKRVIPAQGIAPVVNPYDPQATEAALRLKDAAGEGKITVISLGEDSARDAIKHALAMGADEGVLLSDPDFENIDNFQTAVALSRAIEKIGDVDLVLMGRASADWDMGVGPPGRRRAARASPASPSPSRWSSMATPSPSSACSTTVSRRWRSTFPPSSPSPTSSASRATRSFARSCSPPRRPCRSGRPTTSSSRTTKPARTTAGSSLKRSTSPRWRATSRSSRATPPRSRPSNLARKLREAKLI